MRRQWHLRLVLDAPGAAHALLLPHRLLGMQELIVLRLSHTSTSQMEAPRLSIATAPRQLMRSAA